LFRIGFLLHKENSNVTSSRRGTCPLCPVCSGDLEFLIQIEPTQIEAHKLFLNGVYDIIDGKEYGLPASDIYCPYCDHLFDDEDAFEFITVHQNAIDKDQSC
jgi:hypothetical protein